MFISNFLITHANWNKTTLPEIFIHMHCFPAKQLANTIQFSYFLKLSPKVLFMNPQMRPEICRAKLCSRSYPKFTPHFSLKFVEISKGRHVRAEGNNGGRQRGRNHFPPFFGFRIGSLCATTNTLSSFFTVISVWIQLAGNAKGLWMRIRSHWSGAWRHEKRINWKWWQRIERHHGNQWLSTKVTRKEKRFEGRPKDQLFMVVKMEEGWSSGK